MRTSKPGLHRRQVLAALTGAVACGPPPPAAVRAAPPRGPPWRPPGAVDASLFPFGLRAGDPAADGFVLSGRTLLPEVVLLAARRDGDRWVELPPRPGLRAEAGFVSVEVTGLAPDTDHTFVLTSRDGTVRSEAGRYRTLPSAPRVVTFGATSCLGNHDPAWPTLADAAGRDLDLMLLLGDTIYTRAKDLDAYRAEYEALHAHPAFAALAAATPLVAVWDDHEVANDWVLGEDVPGATGLDAEQLQQARIAFTEGLPQRLGTDGAPWRSLTVGDTLELLLLDCRGERSPPDRIVSDAQLAWAVGRLRASPCAFVGIVSSVHLTDHDTWMSLPGSDEDVRDRWQGFADQRQALLAAAEVPGRFVVTGDMHYGGVQRVSAAGSAGGALIEVAAGPAGSGTWDVEGWLAGAGADLDRYLALASFGTWARFVADPVAGVLTVELIDGDGRVVAVREVVRL